MVRRPLPASRFPTLAVGHTPRGDLNQPGAWLAGEAFPWPLKGRSNQRLNHYSLLRTLEDGFGISRHLAHASHARPIVGVWR